MSDKNLNWTEWRQFPIPEKMEFLYAPFGAGVYQLRHKSSKEYILFGRSKNVAHRMTSLLHGYGGTRKNIKKRKYVREHIDDIEYRTIACRNKDEAIKIEKIVKEEEDYIFKK